MQTPGDTLYFYSQAIGAMHRHQPELFTQTITEWARDLPD